MAMGPYPDSAVSRQASPSGSGVAGRAGRASLPDLSCDAALLMGSYLADLVANCLRGAFPPVLFLAIDCFRRLGVS